MAKILIPLALQRLTEGKGKVEISAKNISELIDELELRFPGTKKLIAPGGKVQQFINIYVNDKDIRFLQNESSLIKDSDEINIVLAVSGG